MPTYDGETPTKEPDEQYRYTFAGWDKDVTAVTGDVTYEAEYLTEENDSYTDPHAFSYKKFTDSEYYYISDYNGNNTKITVPNNIDGKIISTVMRYDINPNDQASQITDIIISDGINTIGKYAFAGYTALKTISLPDSVASIGSNAFYNCQSLESIVIPDKATSIGPSAFNNCTGLKSVTIPESVEKIDMQAFFKCDSLQDVYYKGTKSQWDKIAIANYNDSLLNAEIHYSVIPETPETPDIPDKPDKPDRLSGDVDGDGKVSAKDSMLIQRYVIKLKQLDDEQLLAADVNADNKVTNKDALDILRFTIKQSKNENIGKPIV